MRLEPRVAVAMAVYNDERYLPLALDALCAQGFPDLHLTIYDDGSTDASAAVAESYAGRLPLRVVRGGHVGLQRAKKAALAHAPASPYLMMLDADIVLGPGTLARMVASLEANPRVAAVSSRYRAPAGRPWSGAQAFLDDVFFSSIATPSGESRWLAGGCVLLRRAALAGVELRADLSEDQDLSEKLRERWRLLLPPDLVALHFGVPTTLRGVLRRFYREGIRVRALHRAYPGAWQVGSLSRLVPLPLLLLLLAGVALPWLAAVAGTVLALHLAAFLAVSRNVAASLRDRIAGGLLFTFGNAAYGAGYLRELLRGGGGPMREPERSS